MKHEIKLIFVLILFFSLPSLKSLAQAPTKLDYKAKSLEGGVKDGVSYKKLIGNVRFTQGLTIIYCDSALAYDKTNSMQAFGRVRIEDLQDSVTITSNRLDYDGNGRIAKLRGDVIYVDDSIRLFTDNLDYDMTNKSAKYFEGGRIVDGVNTMISKEGDYDTEGKMMFFRDSVKLITPERTLESDDLFYNIVTKKARTVSETTITTNDGRVLNSQNGSEFDTNNGTYTFEGGNIDTDQYYIEGDKLYYNQQIGAYSALGNVYLFAKLDSVIITGEEANFYELSGRAEIYGEPLMKKALQEDTLYLRADTLVSINDSIEANKRLLAYHNVKVYKSDLQGKADSLAYFLADSAITFYEDPILWNDASQIFADTIQIFMKNGNIDRLNANVNSFIISEDSTEHFNQIKGRKMIAYFDQQAINFVDVNGNGETIYFVADEENTGMFVGMNKIVCSDIQIGFKENQVDNIKFFVNPDGDFVPPHELNDPDAKLEGFEWRIKERPTREMLLYDSTFVEEIPVEVEELTGVEKLDKLMEDNIDIDKIKDQLKSPEETEGQPQ